MQDHFVYILKSEKHGRFYTGMSADIDGRLITHNLGLVKSTKNGTPWVNRWSSQVMTKKQALTLERKIKKRGAARFLEDLKTQLG